MRLNISKPLIVFDLETTGLDLVNDRIIQISYIKIHPDGKEERNNIFVNPGKPIPQDVTALTGISDDDVKDSPLFKDIAVKLSENFRNCDFAGFNSNHFDIPMLAEEFLRAGIDFDFSRCRLIDAQTIFIRWNGAILQRPISSIVVEKWKKTSVLIEQTRTQKLHIVY